MRPLVLLLLTLAIADCWLTFTLFRFREAYEVNPVPAFVHHHAGLIGLACLKAASIVLFLVILRIVFRHSWRLAMVQLVIGVVLTSVAVIQGAQTWIQILLLSAQ